MFGLFRENIVNKLFLVRNSKGLLHYFEFDRISYFEPRSDVEIWPAEIPEGPFAFGFGPQAPAPKLLELRAELLRADP